MKKISTLLLVLFFGFLGSAYAVPGGNCDTTLIGDSPNWREQVVIQGSDGYLWRRAVISSQKNGIQLEEGEPLKIYGLAGSEALVQVLVFPLVDSNLGDGENGIQPPAGMDGICFETQERADYFGKFLFEYMSQPLWANLGGEQVIDAFYRTETTWVEYENRQKAINNSNVFIGSHVQPLAALVGGAGEVPANCTSLCDSGLVESVFLNPGDLENGFLGDNFNSPEISGNAVQIGRFPGDFTYYSSLQGDTNSTHSPAKVEQLRWITQKAIGMEILKRTLLGTSTVRVTQPGLPALTPSDVTEAFFGRGPSSQATQDIVHNIRAVLVGKSGQTPLANANIGLPDPDSIPPLPIFQPSIDVPGSPPVVPPPPPPPISRDDGLIFLDLIMNRADPTNPGERNDDLVKEIFSESISDMDPARWAEYFVRLIIFWTGNIVQNDCLLADTQGVDGSFELSPIGSSVNQCGYPYVTGVTPTLLLHTKQPLMLSPDFQDILMTSSSEWFSLENAWEMPEGVKNPLSYKFKFTSAFAPGFIGESCIMKDDIKDFSLFLQKTFSLFSSEKEILVHELEQKIKNDNSFYHLRLANPEDILKRFIWKGNAEKLNIFQLFFQVSENTCGGKDFGLFPEFPQAEREGFEAGFLP